MESVLAISRGGDIALTVFLFAVGLLLIIKGGDWFVDSASRIAEISGIPSFIIGATVVSLGTTLPELITSAIAAGQGNIDIAIGNAVGSVNANIGLIMAVSLLFMPHAFDKKTYLFKGLTMIAAVVILFLMSLKGYLNAYLSIILLAIFVAFVAENIIVGKKEAARANVMDNGLKPAVIEVGEGATQTETTENAPLPSSNGVKPVEIPVEQSVEAAKKAKADKTRIIVKSVIMFIIGAAAIVGGAQLLVTYGSKLAGYMRVPERIVAITLVAIGTSLPELVTTITSIVKKKHDLSIGNIIGANVIDLCLILPICAMITGGTLPVSQKSLFIDMPFCIGLALLAIIPAWASKKFSRAQGATILATYVAYMVVSIVL